MDSPHGAAVKAEDFGLKGPRGWIFRGVGIDAEPGSLIALEGPSGTGRTCLLLALTGRMKPTEGHAEIGGHRLPKKMAAVRRIAALGPVSGVNELDQALTVAEQLREGELLQRHYGAPIRALLRPRAARRARRARIDAALAATGLDLEALPKGPRTSVRDLERLECVRLSVAIALLGSPRLLALDDLDLKLSDAERVEAWSLLRSVAARGTTVIAVCSEAPEDVTVLRTVTTGSDAPADDPADEVETAATDEETADADTADAETAEEAPADGGPADRDAAGNGPGDSGPAGHDTTDEDDTKGADDAFTEARRA
ncbi:ATP-binding cassette domain-containing protein [Streptomyces sp. NPDC002990]